MQGWGLIPGFGELRSQMPWGRARRRKLDCSVAGRYFTQLIPLPGRKPESQWEGLEQSLTGPVNCSLASRSYKVSADAVTLGYPEGLTSLTSHLVRVRFQLFFWAGWGRWPLWSSSKANEWMGVCAQNLGGLRMPPRAGAHRDCSRVWPFHLGLPAHAQPPNSPSWPAQSVLGPRD